MSSIHAAHLAVDVAYSSRACPACGLHRGARRARELDIAEHGLAVPNIGRRREGQIIPMSTSCSGASMRPGLGRLGHARIYHTDFLRRVFDVLGQAELDEDVWNKMD